jgi:DNA-binding CsgD family transcriptional regulator
MTKDPINAVCSEYGVTRKRLLSDERTTRVSLARTKAAWLMLEAGRSRAEIAVILSRTERMVNMMIARYAKENGGGEAVDRIARANTKQDMLVDMFRQNIPLKRIAEATGYSYGSVRTIASRLRKKVDLPDARRRD